MTEMTTELDRQIKQTLISDFEKYAPAMLQVSVREGRKRVPFKLRPAQVWLHRNLEEEIKERGYVRSLVPKARQLGASTYIGGRFFKTTTTHYGVNTYILAHTNESTANVFKMVKNFYQDLERRKHVVNMCPDLATSNARELMFSKLTSQYRVQSAEGKDVGVGTTNQLLHLSEVALYKASADLSAGLMNTVHLMPGTEIIMESTGRGPSGMFYQMCQQAINEGNKGLWRAYFMPWHWDPDYVAPVPEGFEFPMEFIEYGQQYQLRQEQLYWFYLKNVTTATQNGGHAGEIHHITRQEYPINIMECFQSASEYSFFKPEHIMRARNHQPVPLIGQPRILAIDPSLGGDATFIADRQGNTIGARVWQGVHERDQNVQADIITNLVFQHDIDAIVIDATGLGVGLLSALRSRLEGRVPVQPVIFSSKALQPLAYVNRRAELFDLFRLFIEGDGFDQASIPQDDWLMSEMTAIEWGPGKMYRNHENKLQAMPKENIKKEINGRSPDRLDCCMLLTGYSDATIARLVAQTQGTHHG